MSFILDAIKKSENERQKHRQPDVHSLQGSAGYVTERKKTSSRLLLLVISVAIIVAIIYWLWPRLNQEFIPSQLQPHSDVQYAVKTTVDKRDKAVASPVQNTAINNPAIGRSESALVPISAVDSDADLPPRHLIKEFWELPADFQSTVPDMEFSFHVFSKDPARRTIYINERSVKEGQMVASGLKLRVITPTGLILHYKDRFFHIDVVEKW